MVGPVASTADGPLSKDPRYKPGLDAIISKLEAGHDVKAINTREEALKTIKDSSSAFFFVAALQAAIGIWLATQYPTSGFDVGETIIDVAIYAVFAAWLRWGLSRTAAVVLLLAATVALAMTIGAQLKIIQGGKNIWLALIVFWAAVKAVEATFKVHGRFKQDATEVEPQFG